MLITTITVIISSSTPVLTQYTNGCLIESPIDAQEAIDTRIERSELEFEEAIENGIIIGNYYDKAATDQFNENKELIRRIYYVASSGTRIVDSKIENNELKCENNDPLKTDYYYRVAADTCRPDGILSKREYYDINGRRFAVIHYGGYGMKICADYYDCNGVIIPGPFPCFGIY